MAALESGIFAEKVRYISKSYVQGCELIKRCDIYIYSHYSFLLNNNSLSLNNMNKLIIKQQTNK